MLALLASTFVTVFLAELGDKTQLAIVSISGTSNRPGAVFAGSSFALVLASLVGAAAGGSLSSVVPANSLQLAAAAGFLIIGTRLILRSSSGKADPDSSTASATDSGSANATGSANAAAIATEGLASGAGEEGHDGEPTAP